MATGSQRGSTFSSAHPLRAGAEASLALLAIPLGLVVFKQLLLQGFGLFFCCCDFPSDNHVVPRFLVLHHATGFDVTVACAIGFVLLQSRQVGYPSTQLLRAADIKHPAGRHITKHIDPRRIRKSGQAVTLFF